MHTQESNVWLLADNPTATLQLVRWSDHIQVVDIVSISENESGICARGFQGVNDSSEPPPREDLSCFGFAASANRDRSQSDVR